jgi:hypothetical protein
MRRIFENVVFRPNVVCDSILYNNFQTVFTPLQVREALVIATFFKLRQPLCKIVLKRSVQITQPRDEGKPNLEVVRGLMSGKQ